MIRLKNTVDLTPLDNLIDAVSNADSIMQGVGQAVYDQWANQMLAELRTEPGAAKKPIQWTSDKQRRYVMAKLREEDNLPYKRTHQLSEGWESSYVLEGNGIVIIVRNPAPSAKFVYGSLAKNPAQALRFQQQFHRNTGWQFARNTVYLWLEVMDKAFRREFALALINASKGRTRAYTR
jgi:hypothetical protein